MSQEIVRYVMCQNSGTMYKKFKRERVLIKRKIEGSGERFIVRDILSKAFDHRIIKYMFEFFEL